MPTGSGEYGERIGRHLGKIVGGVHNQWQVSFWKPALVCVLPISVYDRELDAKKHSAKLVVQKCQKVALLGSRHRGDVSDGHFLERILEPLKFSPKNAHLRHPPCDASPKVPLFGTFWSQVVQHVFVHPCPYRK